MIRSVVCLALSSLLLASVGTAQEPRRRALEIYRQKCQSCHKADGTGLGKAMNLADRDWIHGSSIPEVGRVITDGARGTAMMPFGKQFTPEEIDGLARYVRSFDKTLKAER